jgi:transposase
MLYEKTPSEQPAVDVPSTHYRWRVSRDSMVHERDTGSDSDCNVGGRAGRVGWLGALDQDGVPAAAAGAYRAAGAEGLATRAIARRVGCTIGTASKWRVRYAEKRRSGLDETGRRGAAPRYTAQTGKRILAVLDGLPPAGYARWIAPLIAKALGDVHEQYAWRFLRAQKIDLAGRKSWCVSHDPEFAAKAAEIVVLYLDPPEGALVVAVDEKPHIQALERAQGYLKLPNSRASAVLHPGRICRSTGRASPALPNSGNTSMPSSPATIKLPAPSPGPNPRSTRNASNPVSRTSESGPIPSARRPLISNPGATMIEGLLFALDIFFMVCLAYWICRVDDPLTGDAAGGLFRWRSSTKSHDSEFQGRQR